MDIFYAINFEKFVWQVSDYIIIKHASGNAKIGTVMFILYTVYTIY